MKTGTFLLLALLAPALCCPAQDKPSASLPEPQAATVPDAAAPDATKTELDDRYVIGESDTISVSVWKEPDLSIGGTLVRPDGMISMPLLGDVKASGKTPLKLAAEIAGKLAKYVQEPNVMVVLGANNSKNVYMMGEIGRMGPLSMTRDMTLLQAIAGAGGLSEFANKKKIYILRTEGGKQQKIPVQYKQALRGDSSLDLKLKPGDTIVVP